MDPIWLEFDVSQILMLDPAEILAPETPGVSHGTKILGQKFFSYNLEPMCIYEFSRFIM